MNIDIYIDSISILCKKINTIILYIEMKYVIIYTLNFNVLVYYIEIF